MVIETAEKQEQRRERRSTFEAIRAEALFASTLQSSESPSPKPGPACGRGDTAPAGYPGLCRAAGRRVRRAPRDRGGADEVGAGGDPRGVSDGGHGSDFRPAAAGAGKLTVGHRAGGARRSLLAMGVSHRTAPAGLLERVTVPPSDTTALLRALLGQPHVGEA